MQSVLRPMACERLGIVISGTARLGKNPPSPPSRKSAAYLGEQVPAHRVAKPDPAGSEAALRISRWGIDRRRVRRGSPWVSEYATENLWHRQSALLSRGLARMPQCAAVTRTFGCFVRRSPSPSRYAW